VRPLKSNQLFKLLRSLRILVVDDNITNRDILCEQLTALGLRAGIAVGVKEAVGVMYGALSRDPYRIAFLAAQPVMDGFEATRIPRARNV
jgi:CheY-like chemotaxis protein